VLREDVARLEPLHQKRADIANHGSQPIARLERVRAAHRNRFLPQARIQPAHDLVLPEEPHHALLELPVELHEIIKLDLLLSRQRTTHARVSFTAPACAPAFSNCSGGRLLPAIASSNWPGVTQTISRSHTSPKWTARRPRTSAHRTGRPRIRPSDVARRSAIPHGTIKSK